MLLTVNQFCDKHPWPTQSALRAIILESTQKEKYFEKVFKWVGRRVLVDEDAFWKEIEKMNT